MPPVERPARTWCSKSSIALVSEVSATHVLVATDVLSWATHHDLAGFDQVGPVGKAERGGRVLLDQQHAHALFFIEAAQDGVHLADNERGKAERRLVKQH